MYFFAQFGPLKKYVYFCELISLTISILLIYEPQKPDVKGSIVPPEDGSSALRNALVASASASAGPARKDAVWEQRWRPPWLDLSAAVLEEVLTVRNKHG